MCCSPSPPRSREGQDHSCRQACTNPAQTLAQAICQDASHARPRGPVAQVLPGPAIVLSPCLRYLRSLCAYGSFCCHVLYFLCTGTLFCVPSRESVSGVAKRPAMKTMNSSRPPLPTPMLTGSLPSPAPYPINICCIQTAHANVGPLFGYTGATQHRAQPVPTPHPRRPHTTT